ncbi:MAG: hypothetical protein ACOY4K_01475 [Pseudomonadota bacterium]
MSQTASPRRRVGEIRVPVLPIHGDADGIAPCGQSWKLTVAPKKDGRTVVFLREGFMA